MKSMRVAYAAVINFVSKFKSKTCELNSEFLEKQGMDEWSMSKDSWDLNLESSSLFKRYGHDTYTELPRRPYRSLAPLRAPKSITNKNKPFDDLKDIDPELLDYDYTQAIPRWKKLIHSLCAVSYLFVTFAPTYSFATKTVTVEDLSSEVTRSQSETPTHLIVPLQNPDAVNTGAEKTRKTKIVNEVLRLPGARNFGSGMWGNPLDRVWNSRQSNRAGVRSIFDKDESESALTEALENPSEPLPSDNRIGQDDSLNRVRVEVEAQGTQVCFSVFNGGSVNQSVNISDVRSLDVLRANHLIPLIKNSEVIGFVKPIYGLGVFQYIFGSQPSDGYGFISGGSADIRINNLHVHGLKSFEIQNIKVDNLVHSLPQVIIGDNSRLKKLQNEGKHSSGELLLRPHGKFKGYLEGSTYKKIENSGQLTIKNDLDLGDTEVNVFSEGVTKFMGIVNGERLRNFGETFFCGLKSVWQRIENAGIIKLNKGMVFVKSFLNQIDGQKGQVLASQSDQFRIINDKKLIDDLKPESLVKMVELNDDFSSTADSSQKFLNYLKKTFVGELSIDQQMQICFLLFNLRIYYKDIYKNIISEFENSFRYGSLSNYVNEIFDGIRSLGSSIPIEEAFPKFTKDDLFNTLFKSNGEMYDLIHHPDSHPWIRTFIMSNTSLRDDFFRDLFPDSRTGPQLLEFYKTIKNRLEATLDYFFRDTIDGNNESQFIVGNVENWGQFAAPEIQYAGKDIPEGIEVIGNIHFNASDLNLQSLNQLDSLRVDGHLNVNMGDWDERQNVSLPHIQSLFLNGRRIHFHKDLSVASLKVRANGPVLFGDSNGSLSKVKLIRPQAQDPLNPPKKSGDFDVEGSLVDLRYAQVSGDGNAHVRSTTANILLGDGVSHGGTWHTKSSDGYELGFSCVGGSHTHKVTTSCSFLLANNSFFKFAGTTTLDAFQSILMNGADLGSRMHMTLRAGNSIEAKFSNIRGASTGQMDAPLVSFERLAMERKSGIYLSSKHPNRTRDLVCSEGTAVEFMGDLKINTPKFGLLASNMMIGGNLIFNGEIKTDQEMSGSILPMKYGDPRIQSYIPASIRSGGQMQLNEGDWNINGDLSAQQFRAQINSIEFNNSRGRQTLRTQAPQTISVNDIIRLNPTSIGVRVLEMDQEGRYVNDLPGGKGFHPNLMRCLVLSGNFDYANIRPFNVLQNLDMDLIVQRLMTHKLGRVYFKLEDGTIVSGENLVPHLIENGRHLSREYFKKHKRLPTEEEIQSQTLSMIYFLVDELNVLHTRIFLSPTDADKYESGAGEFQGAFVETQGDYTQRNFALIAHEDLVTKIGGSQYLLTEALRVKSRHGYDEKFLAKAIQEGKRILNQVGVNQVRQGAVLHGQEFVTNEAGNNIYDITSVALSEKKYKRKSKTTVVTDLRHESSQITCDAGKATDIAHGDTILYEAPVIYAAQGIKVSVPDGKFERKMAQDQHESHTRIQKKNVLYTKTGGSGKSSTVQVQGELDPGDGLIEIYARDVHVESRPGELEEAFKEALKEYPDAVVQELWDATKSYQLKTKRTLSPYVVSLIAIGVGIATGGLGLGKAGADFLIGEVATQTAGQVTAHAVTHAALTGAINATISSILTQLTVGMINNQGRLGRTLKGVFSKEGLKSIGVSAATAALAASMIKGFELKTLDNLSKGATLSIGDHAKLAGVNLAASTAVGGAIHGDLAKTFLANLRMGAANFLQTIGAQKIGQVFKEMAADAPKADQETASSSVGAAGATREFSFIEQIPRYMMHMGLGGLMGQLASSDGVSRAAGAGIGELAGDFFVNYMAPAGSLDADNPEREKYVAKGLSFVELASLTSAAVLGLDVHEVMTSAEISARENALVVLVVPIAVLCMSVAETFLDPAIKTVNEKIKVIEQSIAEHAKNAHLTTEEQRTLSQAIVCHLDTVLEGISRETLSVSKLAKDSRNYIEYVLKGALATRDSGREWGQNFAERMGQGNRVQNFLSQAGGVSGMTIGLGLSVMGKGKGGKSFKGTKSLSKKDVPQNVNAQEFLNKKMRALTKAPKEAARIKNLPDGRVRYYTQENPSHKIGPTRGSSTVTEYNPKTGNVRMWQECYSQTGQVNRVHPKMINGQDQISPHFPMTKADLEKYSIKRK